MQHAGIVCHREQLAEGRRISVRSMKDVGVSVAEVPLLSIFPVFSTYKLRMSNPGSDMESLY